MEVKRASTTFVEAQHALLQVTRSQGWPILMELLNKIVTEWRDGASTLFLAKQDADAVRNRTYYEAAQYVRDTLKQRVEAICKGEADDPAPGNDSKNYIDVAME